MSHCLSPTKMTSQVFGIYTFFVRKVMHFQRCQYHENHLKCMSRSQCSTYQSFIPAKTPRYFNRGSSISAESGLPDQKSGQTTIDDNEVDKFSKLAKQWWNEDGIFVALHTMNEVRVPLIRDALISWQRENCSSHLEMQPAPLRGLKILDIGSGGGILSEPLARLGAFVTGIDASEENIKMAQAHIVHDGTLRSNIKYIKSTAEDMSCSEAGTFDAVVASEVVEHVADIHLFISACSKLVKSGGSIFLTTINRTLLSYILGVFGAEILLRIVPCGTHEWNKFITPMELQSILSQNSFSTRLLHGMMYNPLTRRWSWTKYTSVSYAVHAVKTSEQSTEIHNHHAA